MSQKILIVDDEPQLREILQFDFEQAGFEVLTAEDGEEAWEVLQEDQDVDAVVSDLVMPKLNGIELLQKARSLGPKPVFIFITGYSDYDESKIFELGGNALVKKPFKRRAIEGVCQRLLLPESVRWGGATRGQYPVTHAMKKSWPSFQEASREFEFGRGGMFFVTDEKLSPGDIFHFQLLFGSTLFQGTGVIRWKNQNHFGAEFLFLPSEGFQFWKTHVDLNKLTKFIPKR